MLPVSDAAYLALGAGTLGGFLALARLVVVRIHRRAARSAWHDAARISQLTLAGETKYLATTLVEKLGTQTTSLQNNLGSARRLLAREHLPEAVEVKAAVDEAYTAGEQVVYALRDLWAFQGTASWELVDLNDAARMATRLVEGHAAAEGVSLAVELDERLPSLRGDPAQLTQVALGLVMHAVDKASASSKAAVSVRTLLSNEGIELLVANSGPGISEIERTRLFARLSPLASTSLGLGIRLGAVRSIVEAQAGRIGAERPKSGVLIRVVWPVPPCEPPALPTSAT